MNYLEAEPLGILMIKINPKKPFEAHKFCGIMKSDQDAVTIQRRLRDEWE
jgi:hypothetical protein